MSEIRTILGIARRRLEMTRYLSHLWLMINLLAPLTLILVLADRLRAESFVNWLWVGPVIVAVAVLGALILWLRRRPSEMQVALEVDGRLDLREKIVTALCVNGRTDPFAVAAIDDAVRTAGDARTRVAVGQRFPVEAPRNWWRPMLPLIAAVAVFFMPQTSLFADEEEPVDEVAMAETRVEVETEMETLAKSLEDAPELQAELGDAMQDLAKPGDPNEAEAMKRPEDLRRDALKRVTELNQRLDDILDGEKGKTARALEDMMAKLKAPEDGPAKELAEAMAKGDFAAAQKALEDVLNDLEEGDMDPAQKEQLANQLKQMAEQMNQLAEQQQALEAALQQAGLDPQLANNQQALEQALQQAQNLNEQQKQQIQQMAKAQQAAQQMAQGMAGACQAMANQLGQQGQQGQQGQNAQAGQQMAQQLGQMEALQQLMQQAQAMAGQCQGACQGMGQGMGQKPGMGGMGGWGQGAGGQAPIAPTPTGTKLTEAKSPTGEGNIIAKILVEGTPIRGDSKARLREVVEARAQGFDEAIGEDPLPRRYHETLKHYFGELQSQVESIVVTESEAPAEGEESAGSSGGDDE